MVATQSEAASEGVSGISNGLWAGIAVVATLLGFVAGYALSTRTGIEPGYFLTAEAGGYGAPPKAATEGMSEEMRKHYEGLIK